MRSNITILSAFLLTTSTFAASVIPNLAPPYVEEEPRETTFDGQTVPPMPLLNGTTFTEDISKGNWLVEGYSPWCGHCKHLAPKLQTLYEFYYTSKPDPKTSHSFSSFYDLKFAKVNCVAWGETCVKAMNVSMFPTLVLFKDGVESRRSAGDKSMKNLGAFFEECLESIKPGSRPAGGIELPKEGATTRPESKSTDSSSQSKPKETAAAKTSNLTKPQQTTVTSNANPEGNSTDMDYNAFQNKVKHTQDPWFVKFYAPWCPHCQHLAPTWKTLARDMKGKLNIGEVNCDIQTKLCKEMDIESYPTLLFIKGQAVMPYEGLRGLGDLVDYAEKAIKASKDVEYVDLAQFKKLEEDEDVIFTYFYDHATTSEDFAALDQLPFHLTGRAKLVRTDDAAMVSRFKISTRPQLMVAKDGKPTYYPGTSPTQMRNTTRMIDWMQSNWLPLVPEITSANAQEVMKDKLVVLGILNRSRKDELDRAKRELKAAAAEWFERENRDFQSKRQELRDAKQQRIEQAEGRKDVKAVQEAKLIKIDTEKIKRQRVAFAWVDGVFWERWVRATFGASATDEAAVVVYDDNNRLYWDTTPSGQRLNPSQASILETLPDIVSPSPKTRSHIVGSTLGHVLFRLGKFSAHHPFYALVGVLGSATAVYVWWKRTSKRRRSFGGRFINGGSEKLGLLGGGGGVLNGKAD